jgi:hypothetical protein
MASNFKFWMSPIGENVSYVWGDKKCYLLDNIDKRDEKDYVISGQILKDNKCLNRMGWGRMTYFEFPLFKEFEPSKPMYIKLCTHGDFRSDFNFTLKPYWFKKFDCVGRLHLEPAWHDDWEDGDFASYNTNEELTIPLSEVKAISWGQVPWQVSNRTTQLEYGTPRYLKVAKLLYLLTLYNDAWPLKSNENENRARPSVHHKGFKPLFPLENFRFKSEDSDAEYWLFGTVSEILPNVGKKFENIDDDDRRDLVFQTIGKQTRVQSPLPHEEYHKFFEMKNDGTPKNLIYPAGHLDQIDVKIHDHKYTYRTWNWEDECYGYGCDELSEKSDVCQCYANTRIMLVKYMMINDYYQLKLNECTGFYEGPIEFYPHVTTLTTTEKETEMNQEVGYDYDRWGDELKHQQEMQGYDCDRWGDERKNQQEMLDFVARCRANTMLRRSAEPNELEKIKNDLSEKVRQLMESNLGLKKKEEKKMVKKKKVLKNVQRLDVYLNDNMLPSLLVIPVNQKNLNDVASYLQSRGMKVDYDSKIYRNPETDRNEVGLTLKLSWAHEYKFDIDATKPDVCILINQDNGRIPHLCEQMGDFTVRQMTNREIMDMCNCFYDGHLHCWLNTPMDLDFEIEVKEKQDAEVKEERITLKKPAKKADAVTTYSFMEMPVITLKRNKKQKI